MVGCLVTCSSTWRGMDSPPGLTTQLVRPSKGAPGGLEWSGRWRLIHVTKAIIHVRVPLKLRASHDCVHPPLASPFSFRCSSRLVYSLLCLVQSVIVVLFQIYAPLSPYETHNALLHHPASAATYVSRRCCFRGIAQRRCPARTRGSGWKPRGPQQLGRRQGWSCP